MPAHITTDRGVQFTSTLWQDLCKAFGSTLHFTTAYHPQSNGMVERFHRSLKNALKCRMQGPNWASELPWVLLGLRSTPKEDISASTAELLYGTPLVLPCSFWPSEETTSRQDMLQFLRQASETVAKLVQPPKVRRKETVFIPASLESCAHVFIRDDKVKPPLTPPYSGPFKVLERGELSFKVQIGEKSDWVSIARLKPAFTDIL